MNSPKLPIGLRPRFDDDKLAAASEQTAHLTAEDLRNVGDATIVNLDDGRQVSYYSYPVDNAEGTIFFYQAFNQDMTPQAMAQVYAMQALLNHSVVVCTQNSIRFNAEERKMIASGDFSPYGEMRIRAIEHALGGRALDTQIVLAGYSFGATDAAASGGAIAEHEAFKVDTALLAEPANIAKRSYRQLLNDFVNFEVIGLTLIGKDATGTKGFIHAVQDADFPALTELYEISPDGKKSKYLDRDILRFLNNLRKRKNSNWKVATGLTNPTFAAQVIKMLDAMADNGLVMLHKDADSTITPLKPFNTVYKEVNAANALRMQPVRIERLDTYTDNGQGHATGDNPWAWATIIRAALEAQKRT